MPIQKLGTKGDLYIVFTVEMPDPDWLKTIDTKVCHILVA